MAPPQDERKICVTSQHTAHPELLTFKIIARRASFGARNPKQSRNTKSRMIETRSPLREFPFRISHLSRISRFEFRVWLRPLAALRRPRLFSGRLEGCPPPQTFLNSPAL